MRKGFSKSSAVLFAAAVSVLIGLLGCDNTTNSDSGKSYTGVLGELSGVVFDELTGIPLEGVLVSTGERSAKTNKAGAFTIDKVIPGTYTVSYSLAGYRIATRKVITVDSQKYLDDDPYLEKDAYDKYAALFTKWLTDRGAIQMEMAQEDQPYLPGDGWTYNGGGTFTADGGNVQVTYSEETGDFDFTFEPDIKKLDYTYRYGITLEVVALKPLNAGFDGEIKIVLAAADSVAHPAPISAPAGLRVWFKDMGIVTPATAEPVYEDGDDDENLAIRGIYKAETDRNGKFTVTGLPANTRFGVQVNNFSHTVSKETYYFDGTKVYLLETANLATPTPYAPVDTLANGSYTLKPIVLYAEKEVVFVSAYKAGTLADPIPVRDKEGVDAKGAATTIKAEIELTFTEALDPSSFSAYLEDLPVAAAAPPLPQTDPRGYGYVKLKAVSWSADKKTVTLAAADIPDVGYGTITLPYNEFETAYLDQNPTGTVSVRAKKADGTEAFVASKVPVYTEEKIKLLSVEVLEPTDPRIATRPSRSLFTVKLTGAVMLTFSKPISKDSINTDFTFGTLGAKEHPDYMIDATNGAIVYVFIDQKIPYGARTAISYRVVSAAHSDDFIGSVGTPLPTDDQFTTDGLQHLVVSNTNLYDPNPVVSHDNGYPLDVVKQHSYFPVEKNIEITFTRVVENGKAKVELFLGNAGWTSGQLTNKVPLTTLPNEPDMIAINGKTLSIDPSYDLEPNSTYYLSLNVFDEAGDLIYTTEGLARTALIYVDIATPVDNHIAFTTAQRKLLLVDTKLYDDQYKNTAASTLAATPWLALDGTIELEFDRPIPIRSTTFGEDLEIKLSDDVDLANANLLSLLPSVIDGNKLLITPAAPFVNGEEYYLYVSIRYGSQILFNTDDDDYWETYNGKPVAIRETTGANEDSIHFQVENKLDLYDGTASPALPTEFIGDEDIVLSFTKDVTLFAAGASRLYYVDATGAMKDLDENDYTITPEGKTVTVSPKFTFAETNTERVYLALYVASVTDDVASTTEYIVWDTYWKDNSYAVPVYATVYESIELEVDEPSNQVGITGPLFRSQKAIKPLEGAAFAPDPVRGGDPVDISWNVSVDDPINYTVWYKWPGTSTWTVDATGVPIDSADTKYVLHIPAVNNTRIGPLDYYIQGVDQYGFVWGSNVTINVKGAPLAITTTPSAQVVPATGVLNWSQVSTNTTPFEADKDIILVFNKNLKAKTVTDSPDADGDYGVFYYNDGGILRPSDAAFTVAGKTLTIDPAHRLTVGNFAFSFKVTSEDEDTLEYNASKSNPDGSSKLNVTFTTIAAAATSSDLPIDLNIRVVDIDSGNLNAVSSVPNEIVSIGLAWSIPQGGANLASTAYTIGNRLVASAGWTNLSLPTITTTTRADSPNTVVYRFGSTEANNLAVAGATDAQTIVYGVEAVNNQGFALAGTAQVVVRAPKLNVVGTPLGSRGSVLTAIDLDEDIVIQFNKPVSGINATNTRLYFTQGLAATPLVSGTDYTITTGERHVTIKPAFLLADGQNFLLRLYVNAVDGDTYIADNTSLLPTTSPTATVAADITFTSSGPTPAIPVAPAVSFAKPLASTLAVTVPLPATPANGVGLPGNSATIPAADITLRWANVVIPTTITQPWTVYERGTVINPTWTPVRNGTYNGSAAGNTDAQIDIVNAAGSALVTEPHTSLRKIAYIVESVTAKGFLAQGTKEVTFTD
jgi:hypothetical protein